MGLTADQKKAAKRAAKAGGTPTVTAQTAPEAAKPTNGKTKSSESATPAGEEKSEEPPAAKSKLLAELDEVLDSTSEAPAETPVVESITSEEAAAVAAEPETDNAPEAPAMRIGEDELVALIDERINLGLAPIRSEMDKYQQELQSALNEVSDLFSKLEEIDAGNAAAISRYATPATQTAFDQLVAAFWNGEWKPTMSNLLSEILELKGKVESDEGNRTALNRALPALELMTQIPQVKKELADLVEAGKAIEGRIAAKVAELKGGNAQTPAIQTPTSRFATSK